MGVCVVEVWCVGVSVGTGCALKQLAGDLWVARFEVFKKTDGYFTRSRSGAGRVKNLQAPA
jgi:hypothetical protein